MGWRHSRLPRMQPASCRSIFRGGRTPAGASRRATASAIQGASGSETSSPARVYPGVSRAAVVWTVIIGPAQGAPKKEWRWDRDIPAHRPSRGRCGIWIPLLQGISAASPAEIGCAVSAERSSSPNSRAHPCADCKSICHPGSGANGNSDARFGGNAGFAGLDSGA